jgi:hypothetical protein
MACVRRISEVEKEKNKKAVTVYYPPEGIEMSRVGIDSPFWDDDMFKAHFRFKKAEFRRFSDAMHLTGKSILCGRKGFRTE